jgi:hypothetical protein
MTMQTFFGIPWDQGILIGALLSPLGVLALFVFGCWSAHGFPLRRKRKFTPVGVGTQSYGRTVIMDGGTNIDCPILPSPGLSPQESATVQKIRYEQFRRDCLDLDMDLEEFANKWRGKVPRKPEVPLYEGIDQNAPFQWVVDTSNMQHRTVEDALRDIESWAAISRGERPT